MWKPIVALMVTAMMASEVSAQPGRYDRVRPPFVLPVPPPLARPLPLPLPRPVLVPGRDRDDALERSIERQIRSRFGRYVDDVDVDIDIRDREADVEVEVRDYYLRSRVRNFVYSMPELRRYRIRLDIND